MDKKFWTIVGILVLMWCILIVFFYLKADEVTKHPCQVCAQKIGREVFCTAQGASMLFHPNGSIEVEILNPITPLSPGG